MSETITGLQVRDLRFPTSQGLHGSDAMNAAPDYSACYVTLLTGDHEPAGFGFTFTIGRGNELCTAAVELLAPLVIGTSVSELVEAPGALWRRLTGDSQMRWVGPEKGVVHLATAAIVNAAWDLVARRAGQPVWSYLAELDTELLLDAVPLRYLEDALNAEQARDILQAGRDGLDNRRAKLLRDGYPAYTTSVGWAGYTDDQIRQLCRTARREGWQAYKLKVGLGAELDAHRLALLREELGDGAQIMIDANQVWEVEEAIDATRRLAGLNPYWIEEPTSPDDILGHAAIARAVSPIRVASGEHCHNRVMFKQLMQANAISVCQLDCCRLAGINEALAVLLLAARFDVPVCPHAGGVGLCEVMQHVSMFDFLRVSQTTDGRRLEFVDHLHEHFLTPVRIDNGYYLAPTTPGLSTQIYEEIVDRFEYPTGPTWATELTR